MHRLIAETRAALASQLFLLSLQSALATIDICAALNSEDGRTSGAKFKEWFQTHLREKYPNVEPHDLYLIRCGVLHQGKLTGSGYDAILFTLPTASNNVFHNNTFDNALNLDLNIFVNEILAAVETWWEANRETTHVARNASDMMQLRPNGLAPYIVGTPILA